jgi:hypothetical protein
MPGGLLQLASCADNKLLIDNLNFSHFKLVYKTSHPFSFQDLNIKFKGQNNTNVLAMFMGKKGRRGFSSR